MKGKDIDEATREKIRADRAAGMLFKQLAYKYGISPAAAHYAVHTEKSRERNRGYFRKTYEKDYKKP